MTQYELAAVAKAMERALETGAPRISELMRQAIIHVAVVRLQHQFNVPAPAPTAVALMTRKHHDAERH